MREDDGMEGVDVRCPDCGFVMIARELRSGGIVMWCGNCRLVHV